MDQQPVNQSKYSKAITTKYSAKMISLTQLIKLISVFAILFIVIEHAKARPFADASISGTLLSNFVGAPYVPSYTNNVAYNGYYGAGYY